MMTWLVLILLLTFNAFYVAAEFASVSLPKSRLGPMAERGNKGAQALLHLLGDAHRLDRYIAACQVGITWSSLVLGAYGQAAFLPGLSGKLQALFHLKTASALSIASIIILVLLTSTQMILGELVPKSLALHNPLRVGMLTVVPMRWSMAVYSWFISFLNGSGEFLLRILGREVSGHGHIHSPEEIALLLSESEKGGLLAPEEEERLLGALKLGSRPISQLMTPRLMIRGIRLDAPPAEVLDTVAKASYMRLPVFDGDKVAGIVFSRDAIKFYLENQRAPTVREILQPTLFVPERMTADKLYLFLQEHAAHLVMVVDEYGSVAGLVTLDDLVAEMLGDMPDEFKRGPTGPETLPDGRVRILGSMRLDEIGYLLRSPWKGQATTAGGMAMEVLGRLPVPGETFRLGEVEIEVERMDGNVLVSLLLIPSKNRREANG
jgi:putative hemolysin